MLHPSYTDLINVVNSDIEPGEQPVVQSRYSIVVMCGFQTRQTAYCGGGPHGCRSRKETSVHCH